MASSNSSSNSTNPFLQYPPDHVFSTGQTINDFIQLAKVSGEMQEAGGTSSLKLPPVLLYPNYIPENRGPALFAGFLVLAIIPTIAIALRNYTRLAYAPRKLVLEDWIMNAALVVFIGITGKSCWACLDLQWGYHLYDWTYHSLVVNGPVFFVHEILSLVDVFLIRISLILFIRRLYLQSGSRFVFVCNGLVGVNAVVLVGLMIAYVFGCGANHARASWDFFEKNRLGCNKTRSTWIHNAINSACDAAVLLLPVKVAVGMMTKPFWEKVRIWALLGVGCIAWVASLTRFYYIHMLDKNGDVYSAVNGMLATSFECCIAICCSCAPAIKSLVSFIFFDKAQRDVGFQQPNIAPLVGIPPEGASSEPVPIQELKPKKLNSMRMYGVSDLSTTVNSTIHSTIDTRRDSNIMDVDLEKNMTSGVLRELDDDLSRQDSKSDDERSEKMSTR